MPLRVHAHAVIRVGDRIVVHRRQTHERDHLTLPGGRVKDRESVTEALRREILEETGIEVVLGDLLFAGEVNATSRQDILLIFGAQPAPGTTVEEISLVDPGAVGAESILPPVLDRLGAAGPTWLGELYRPQLS